MTTTPFVAAAPVDVNTSAASRVNMLTLEDGRVLVAYASPLGNGTFAVRGRLLDAVTGAPEGAEFTFGDLDTSGPINRALFTMTLLGNGNVNIGVELDGSQTDANGDPIVLMNRDFSFAGQAPTPVSGTELVVASQNDAEPGALEGQDIENNLRVFIDDDLGQVNIIVRTNGTSAPAQTLTTTADKTALVATTRLENGNVVIVVDRDGKADTDNSFQTFILGPDGTQVASFDVTGPDFMKQPEVTALTGGGFVIAGTEVANGQQNIIFGVFDADGSPQSGTLVLQKTGVSDVPGAAVNNEPSVVALNDGGFVIFYDQDAGANQGVRGQRFDQNGNEVGTDFLVAQNSSNLDVSAAVLDNGLLAVSHIKTPANDVETVIVGTDPVQHGTDGDDTMNGTEQDDNLIGLDGGDVIIGGAGDDILNGGDGNDFLAGDAPAAGQLIATGPNLLVNGTFNAGLFGWTINNPTGNGAPLVNTAQRVVSFNAQNETDFGDSIEQSFATTSREPLQVSFDLFEDNNPVADHDFRVDILDDTGTVIATQTVTAENETLKRVELVFVPTTDQTTLRITNTGATTSINTDGKVDNVVVTDLLGGVDGDDIINAGAGDDTILYQNDGGSDQIDGGTGDDTLLVRLDEAHGQADANSNDRVTIDADGAGLVLNQFGGLVDGTSLSVEVFTNRLDITDVENVEVSFGLGNDTLVLNTGASSLAVLTFDGGAGQDLAVFDGSFADFAFVTSEGQVTVQDTQGGGGISTLSNFETFRFDDGDVDVAVGLPVLLGELLIVTTAQDVTDANDGLLSLREAIALTNAQPEAVRIIFDQSLAGETFTLTGGELAITSAVEIDGLTDASGAPAITISGNDASRIFDVADGEGLTLKNLSLVNGNATDNGGAIQANGSANLAIENSRFQDNTTAESGGAIAAGNGNLTISGTVFDGNASDKSGGAIIVQDANFVFSDSTFTNNTAGGIGGAIQSNTGLSDKVGKINDSTFTGNSANARGGAIDNVDGLLTLDGVIVTGNSAGIGGGVGSFGDNRTTTEVKNSLIAGNTSTVRGNDIATRSFTGPDFETLGNNLIGDGQDLNRGTIVDHMIDGVSGDIVGTTAAPRALFDAAATPEFVFAEKLTHGDDQDNTILGGAEDEFILALDGNDVASGDAGDDVLLGGLGDDLLLGGAGNDLLIENAGEGADILRGGGGSDTLRVEAIADGESFIGDGGRDLLDLGQATLGQIVNLALGTAGVAGTTINATIETIEDVRTGSGDDEITGSDVRNLLDGGAGDDTISGEGGNDEIFGGDGRDDLGGGAGNDRVNGGSGVDTLVGGGGDDRLDGGGSNDLLNGNNGNDRLIGGGGQDRLLGGAGNDRLIGGSGNDRLAGGTGDDRLVGGPGTDTFVFKLGDDRDVIVDFEQGSDLIELDAALATLNGAQDFVDLGTLNAAGTKFTLTFDGGDELVVQSAAQFDLTTLADSLLIV